MIRTTYTVEERVAIAELLKMADVCSTSTNEGVLALGYFALERAALIMEQHAGPLSLPDDLIATYASNFAAARMRGDNLAVPSQTANIH